MSTKPAPAAPAKGEPTDAPAAPIPAAAPAAPAGPVLTLDEACALFSGRDGGRKPVSSTLLAAFHFAEEAAGRRHSTGTEAQFRERLTAFAQTPA